MLKNYLKTALRSLWKHKEYSVINILGLAIGLTCVILILLYVREELSYDQFHQNKDRIYRLNMSATNPQSGEKMLRAIGPWRLAKELKPDFPDFEYIVRVAPQGRELVEFEDKRFIERNLCFADPEILQMFTFPLLQGDPETVLDEPFSVIITEEIAEKYFGDAPPIGKFLFFEENLFKVTGILEKVPSNSQFQFDIVVSMNAAEQVFSRIVLENWGEGTSETYVMLADSRQPADYTDRFAAFIDSKLEAWRPFSPALVMQPLPDIYLKSQEISSYFGGGDITYVYAFSAIAGFILLIACINFMNLATARSANRAREVGMRKVVGAHRFQLIRQFLSESVLLAVLSLLIAIGLTVIALPVFNSLAGKELTASFVQDGPMLLGLFLITLLVGIISGSYPALFLSAFKPIQVLSGMLKRGAKGSLLRKGLVTFQFAISIFLIAVTAVVYNQLNFARNIKLGFEKDQLVLLGTPNSMRAQYDQFRAELVSHPNIINAAGSSRVPPGRLSSSLRARPEGVPEDQQRGMQTVWTDFDFIETMGFEMAAGRSFSREHASDATSAFILNEAAVRELGWTNESAVGKGFGSSEITDWDSGQWVNRDGRVIGVLKDFHFESLRQAIVPTVYFVAPYMAWNYVIRVGSGDIPKTMAFIEEKWQAYNPETPFEYTFVDENFANLYRAEEQQGKIFGVFAGLAIFVACLGLVGLASFTAEQRTREVGIRKVLGATVSSIIVLISREFTWLVLLAFVVAVPVAWYVMQQWLQNFAYHVELGVAVFAISGLVSMLIAWLTVSYQAVKVALTNPSEALRYE